MRRVPLPPVFGLDVLLSWRNALPSLSGLIRAANLDESFADTGSVRGRDQHCKLSVHKVRIDKLTFEFLVKEFV